MKKLAFYATTAALGIVGLGALGGEVNALEWADYKDLSVKEVEDIIFDYKLVELQEKVTEAEADLPGAQAKATAATEARANAEVAHSPNATALKNAKDAVEAIDKELASLNSALNALNKVKAEELALDPSFDTTDIDKDIKEAEEDIKDKKAEKKTAEAAVETAEGDFNTTLATLTYAQKKEAEAKAELKDVEDKIAAAKADLKKAEDAAEVEAALTDYQNKKKTSDREEKVLNDLKAVEAEKTAEEERTRNEYESLMNDFSEKTDILNKLTALKDAATSKKNTIDPVTNPVEYAAAVAEEKVLAERVKNAALEAAAAGAKVAEAKTVWDGAHEALELAMENVQDQAYIARIAREAMEAAKARYEEVSGQIVPIDPVYPVNPVDPTPVDPATPAEDTTDIKAPNTGAAAVETATASSSILGALAIAVLASGAVVIRRQTRK